MDNYYKTIKLIFRIFHLVTGTGLQGVWGAQLSSGGKDHRR